MGMGFLPLWVFSSICNFYSLESYLEKALFPIDQLEFSLCPWVMHAEQTAHKCDILMLIALGFLPFVTY